jgi:hypothetical protein
MAIAHAQAEREAITAHAETQEDLLELIMPICAVPIGRTRQDRSVDRAGFLFIGSVESERRGVLRQPRGREGIDLQGVERDRTTHAVEMRGTQRSEDLPQPVIMERSAVEPGLEQGEHATVLQARPHRIEGMMASEHRQEEGLHSTARREDRRRVWRAEGSDERRHVALADHPQHQRHVGHRTEVMHRNGHEAPLLHVLPEVSSSRIAP